MDNSRSGGDYTPHDGHSTFPARLFWFVFKKRKKERKRDPVDSALRIVAQREARRLKERHVVAGRAVVVHDHGAGLVDHDVVRDVLQAVLARRLANEVESRLEAMLGLETGRGIHVALDVDKDVRRLVCVGLGVSLRREMCERYVKSEPCQP